MSKQDDGGPAFAHAGAPHSPSDNDGDGIGEQTGMSLRDYLAAKAMQGLYASGTQQVAMMSGDYDGATRDETVCNVNARMAFNAYRIADAMLAARKGPAK